MTNQSPSWARSLARNAASSSTASSATSTTSACSTTSATSACSTTSATSACSTTSAPCPGSARWSAETSEVHCSDTLMTYFLTSELTITVAHDRDIGPPRQSSMLLAKCESDQLDDQLIQSPHVRHDGRDKRDDDAGVRHQLVSRRTNDFPELVQDLADEQGNGPEEPAHRVALTGGITAHATRASGACRARLGHSSSFLIVGGDPRAW